jgi:hypothetical protein
MHQKRNETKYAHHHNWQVFLKIIIFKKPYANHPIRYLYVLPEAVRLLGFKTRYRCLGCTPVWHILQLSRDAFYILIKED